MSGTWNRRTFGGATMAIVTAVGLLATPPSWSRSVKSRS